MEIDGKVAIVTGGGVRLGNAIVLDLARAGARIVLHFSKSALAADETIAAIHQLGGDAIAVEADFLTPTAAARFVVDQTINHFGHADILINSAAIFEQGTLASTTEDAWDRHFAINLKAPFFLTQAFAAAARSHAVKRSHVINIADWRARRPGVGVLAYTLTKSALVTMTEILARELAPDIQVNAIAPGAILPPADEDEAYFDRLANEIPLRRCGSPKDITQSIRYLLQSDFITGETIHVTGGEHL